MQFLAPYLPYVAIGLILLLGLQVGRIERRLGKVVDLLLHLREVRQGVHNEMESERAIVDDEKRRKT